jgi:4-amino-4-deoxy-L-arabinose transferase
VIKVPDARPRGLGFQGFFLPTAVTTGKDEAPISAFPAAANPFLGLFVFRGDLGLDDGQPHLAKPPLTYWAIGASVEDFGRNEWAARLPDALAMVLTALLVARIAALLGFRRPAFAALVWMTSLGPYVGFNFVTTDALLTLFETAAVAAFLQSGAHRSDRPEHAWIAAMWVAFALAFLTKGPPALLPLIAIAIWLAAPHGSTGLRRLVSPTGIAVFAVLSFGWFVALIANDPRLLGYFVGFEFLQRIGTGVHHRNPSWTGLLIVYGPTLLVGALPWLLYGLRRPRGASGGIPAGAGYAEGGRFLWLWFGVPVTIFAVGP